ncbi:hypothetical protein C8R45DRAFT_946003 [Mycena sanguinolenta]|nr:hypothetical protein C8R45DRAFT_946003 [Mycena sanguinolenta]
MLPCVVLGDDGVPSHQRAKHYEKLQALDPKPEKARWRGRKPVLQAENVTLSSFVTHPWAERAASYLPAIQRLTLQKWQDIYDLGREFTNLTTSALDNPFETSTDGGDSTDDYVDPRSCIVVSDDEDDNPPTGPSHNSSGPTDGESEPLDDSESIHVDGG